MRSYLDKPIRDLAATTQHDYEIIIEKKLIPAFGRMNPDDLTSQDIAMYLARRESDGHGARGNREVAVLSSIINHGMRTGKIRTNPTYGVRRNKERPRTFYIENESLRASLKQSGPGLRHLLWAAYLTGFRQKDLINLRREHLTPDGIKVIQSKDGKHILMAWSESLRSVVRRALARSKCPYVFTNESGQKYTKSGINSAMRRMRAKTGIEWRFHDLRAKAESDHESGLGLMTRYKRAKRLTAVR